MVIEKSKNKSNSQPFTAMLNGKPTELTEEEVALLFDYRLANEEDRKKIQQFIEDLKKHQK